MKKLLILFLFIPATCYAEVMDKEWSLFSLVLVTLCSSFAAYFSARYKLWLFVIVLCVFGFIAFAQLSEITDSFVGSAIASEAGKLYVFFSWASSILVLASGGFGLFTKKRKIT